MACVYFSIPVVAGYYVSTYAAGKFYTFLLIRQCQKAIFRDLGTRLSFTTKVESEPKKWEQVAGAVEFDWQLVTKKPKRLTE